MMCKRVLATGIAVLFIALSFTSISAQTSYIGVFFDEYHTQDQALCPIGGGNGTLYVALMNANAFVSGADYKISYPPSIIWLFDMDVPAPDGPTSVVLGSSPVGVSLGFGIPRNGFFPVPLQRIFFQWNCSGCTAAANDPIIVIPNPWTGDLAYTDFPGFNLIQTIGIKSVVCATIATEETTWGKVKALYR